MAMTDKRAMDAHCHGHDGAFLCPNLQSFSVRLETAVEWK